MNLANDIRVAAPDRQVGKGTVFDILHAHLHHLQEVFIHLLNGAVRLDHTNQLEGFIKDRAELVFVLFRPPFRVFTHYGFTIHLGILLGQLADIEVKFAVAVFNRIEHLVEIYRHIQDAALVGVDPRFKVAAVYAFKGRDNLVIGAVEFAVKPDPGQGQARQGQQVQ